MLKNRINVLDIKALSAAVLPVATIALSKIFSSVLQTNGYNPPGVENCMLVPTSVQSTAYYVSQTTKFHP